MDRHKNTISKSILFEKKGQYIFIKLNQDLSGSVNSVRFTRMLSGLDNIFIKEQIEDLDFFPKPKIIT